MKKSRVEEILPLSPLQEGLLFHALYDGQGPDVYTAQMSVDLDGSVDGDVLRSAAEALLRRHANLRAGFRYRRSGQPVQVIPREVVVPWRQVDLSGLPQADREAELTRLLTEDRDHRFDMSRPPLVRFT
ncbi:condensation domain-containing protein, partial [Rugosimonospora africana]|uniref:condensation domain-containing protein n=1 Tax=Rugosimonospora africana TaxID=556532 RepID=UPI001942C6EA